jgi:hypothetical protein
MVDDARSFEPIKGLPQTELSDLTAESMKIVNETKAIVQEIKQEVDQK